MYKSNKALGSAQYQLVLQQTKIPFFHNKMLIANISELDELPFLKNPHHKWVPDQEEGEKSKGRLLQNLRTISYQCSDLMSKIFACQISTKHNTSANNQNQQQQTQPTIFQELIVTTQKEIFTLQKFYYLINQLLTQEQFSLIVSQIKRFVNKCKSYINDLVCSKYEIDFKNKEFLTFGIYLQKESPNSLNIKKQEGKQILQQFMQKNKFYIKCAVTNFNFEPSREIAQLKISKPQPFVIKNSVIIERLLNIYLELTQIYLPIRPKDIKLYIQNFDLVSHYVDEEYLKLQVIKNYPLLRSRFYVPVIFKDRLTNERLDGPIFSNSDPDCMFGHFIGYNADRIKDLQGNHCEQCRAYIEGVQQNPIMTHLRDNPYNPYKTDVIYCPEFNRFKLILKNQISNSQNEEEEETPKFKTQIKYLNYLHLRSNVKKMTTKKRNKFNDVVEFQKFPLTFDLWGRKILIMDPARGKNCSHYEFTDLRCYYLNKLTENTFRCPICGDIMSDNDILYVKQGQILMKYLKFKCSKFKELVTTGFCYISHRDNKVFIDYKRRSKQNKEIIETDILEVKNYYQTLIDPYYSFNDYTLGIPDKYQKKLKERYMFNNDKQSEDKDSDDDFQYKEFDLQQISQQKSAKTIINTQNQLD